MRTVQNDRKIKLIEKRLKRIEEMIDLLPTVTSFDLKQLELIDKKILNVLHVKGTDGATTTEIADNLGYEDPEGSGRVTVYRRLKRIERVTSRAKGLPFVITESRRWFLNFDDYDFRIKDDVLEKIE
uniref:Uncharacterized protein n=1 Tax=viral metagenome TaxID=1070528 RepID=A0A6M3ID44_9ZZZZ